MSWSEMRKRLEEYLVYLSPFMERGGKITFLLAEEKTKISGKYICTNCSAEISYDRGQTCQTCQKCGNAYFYLAEVL